MDRRDFLSSTGFMIAANGLLSSCNSTDVDQYDVLVKNLLKTWGDGMLAHQVYDPTDTKRHGLLQCPACDTIHGRCYDAVYPFMHLTHVTGEKKYLDAAINVMEWSKNVTGSQGQWTTGINPKSWAGTSIFGAIALAEALHYHGEILDKATLSAWNSRLEEVTENYLWKKFKTIEFTNVNYGLTAVYGYHLIGHVLDQQKYIDRSHKLAQDVKNYFTEPNKLLFGEGKPFDNLSGKKLLPVDLGYNVEESLNGVVLYALKENNEELLELLEQSLNAHLEFMLPDGAWDNSWGTRQAKWTYWGSRTTDGCQPAFSMMAGRNPVFGTAAFKNLELLKRCTANGLLHGGPHYVSHGIKPCIHHTFTHAKALAFILDNKKNLAVINKDLYLPREKADGIKAFPEVAVWLGARGPWRGTVSAYDSQYKGKVDTHIQQATGGSLAVLYHKRIGPVFTASMAHYVMVEKLNMQPQPGEDFSLTPRIETVKDGTRYTNLYDLQADVKARDDGKNIYFEVKTSLCDLYHKNIKDDVARYAISYLFQYDKVIINAESVDGSISKSNATLILPVISPTGENVRVVSEKRIEIKKTDGTVVLESTAPMMIKKSEKDRIFNMVPGMECVPVIIQLPKISRMKAACIISVI